MRFLGDPQSSSRGSGMGIFYFGLVQKSPGMGYPGDRGCQKGIGDCRGRKSSEIGTFGISDNFYPGNWEFSSRRMGFPP